MNNAYLIDAGGKTIPMVRIHCKNEDEELQQILEKNPDLLPGDQINPEDPRRWLTIKREMGVPDPNTGADRWSIDFVVVDQSGIPTFVECKRLKDSRSRREVVGQMFDYAANGQYYWTKEEIEENAKASAEAQGRTLDEALAELRPDKNRSAGEFFALVEENLREGQIRLVFFLEDSPLELRSVVDFLNKQMERTEVLLVEARQYEHNGIKIVVPTLFGYTDQARAVKRHVNVTNPTSSGAIWDEERFISVITKNLKPEEADAIMRFHVECVQAGYSIKWGTGKISGTFSIAKPKTSPKNLLCVSTEGNLGLNFGWLDPELAERLRAAVEATTKLKFSSEYTGKFPYFKPAQWIPHVDEFLKVLVDL